MRRREARKPRGGINGATSVSGRIRERLVRPQVYPLVGVLVLAGASAYAIRHTPETYLESATVELDARNLLAAHDPHDKAGQSIVSAGAVNQSLITTSAMLTEMVMSPQTDAAVRRAGGTAAFHMALVNFYNQDYPEYVYPLTTVTTQSASPAAAHRTFAAVVAVLRRLLAARQARVPRPGRIFAQVTGDTGPVAQPGSLKRSLAALGLLTAIALGLLSSFLARHQARLARALTRARRSWPPAGRRRLPGAG
jgi:hypothetical protein